MKTREIKPLSVICQSRCHKMSRVDVAKDTMSVSALLHNVSIMVFTVSFIHIAGIIFFIN